MTGSACERFGHNWYCRKFGGVYCTRCSAKAAYGCVLKGKAHDHVDHADGSAT